MNNLYELLTGPQKLPETVGIFYKNYDDMKKANTIGGDKYFHAKANCQAAQKGDILNANNISIMREFTDAIYNNPVRKNLSLNDNLSDCLDDLNVDYYGIMQGLLHPLSDCKNLVKKYRPNGLNNKY